MSRTTPVPSERFIHHSQPAGAALASTPVIRAEVHILRCRCLSTCEWCSRLSFYSIHTAVGHCGLLLAPHALYRSVTVLPSRAYRGLSSACLCPKSAPKTETWNNQCLIAGIDNGASHLLFVYNLMQIFRTITR